jgi:hypothetical protein
MIVRGSPLALWDQGDETMFSLTINNDVTGKLLVA